MGQWQDGTGQGLEEAALLTGLARTPGVLLGETHDRADHHLWQAHVAGRLADLGPVVLGFEMFPASADPVLADWVAGRLTEAEFLTGTDWDRVWGFDPALYMPLFTLCRARGLPMVGLNVPRDLVRAVGAGGWEAVPEGQRHGLTPSRPSPPAYRRVLFDLTGGVRPDRAAQSPEDPAFDRFVRAQEVWDRAFATHLVRARARGQVIGIIGLGHLMCGGGVQWQAADLGLKGLRALLPSDAALPPGTADAVWITQPPAAG
ncbi:ChaN family lipoprotein [Stagnihabitans tardus]|uniref:Haem-binding uptake Tiki superfamily ChaN domain-containing protein n=1 Tax=Stagnihabitans tardus TaxID=2699202 RepID=A0AAE4YG88_9RHOB|nr:ChaN family lipoprotein [Stagnihabitans tardus]NBZ89145.1 hypothetical protein [Stagnihabitans tardus]